MKTSSRLLILSAFLFTSSFAAAQDVGQLVLDGEKVPSNSQVSKAMVMIHASGFVCSGVAISKTHILTAGHCLEKKPAPSGVAVYKGANKVRAGAVKAYQIHPAYGWEGGYVRADLAVIKMARAFGSDVVPAPITSEEVKSGLKLVMAGFGYSDRARTKLQTLLQENYIFGRTASFKAGRFSDGSRLLRFDGRDNLCSGDSGGATFRVNSTGLRTVGIHTMANCDSRGFDVYVLDYAKWIKQEAAK